MKFLALSDVLAIHENRIRKFGGINGVRSSELLQSALGNVEATFGGEYLHKTVDEMAAAYLYGICRNHPFMDGNKRTALACALVFLRLNGVSIRVPEDDLYDLVIGVAEGRVSKETVAAFFRSAGVPAG
jgi:death-on-curing protein